MTDLEEKKTESGDKSIDKVSGELASGNVEADVAAQRAALNANRDKRTTMSPDGSKSQSFGITDGNQLIASRDNTQQEFYDKHIDAKSIEIAQVKWFQAGLP